MMSRLLPFDRPLTQPGDLDVISDGVNIQRMYSGRMTKYRSSADRVSDCPLIYAMEYNIDTYFKRAVSIRTDLPFHVCYLDRDRFSNKIKNTDHFK